MAERPLSMREVRGSIPCFSKLFSRSCTLVNESLYFDWKMGKMSGRFLFTYRGVCFTCRQLQYGQCDQVEKNGGPIAELENYRFRVLNQYKNMLWLGQDWHQGYERFQVGSKNWEIKLNKNKPSVACQVPFAQMQPLKRAKSSLLNWPMPSLSSVRLLRFIN